MRLVFSSRPFPAQIHGLLKLSCMANLDKIDLALLSVLAKSGRASHATLSEEVGLSPTACARRQKQLEDQGVITGYQAVLGLGNLGLTTTIIVRITLESQNEDALRKFEQAVVACPSVVRCFLMSGSDDYEVTVLARGIEDYEHIHKTQLSRLPKVARIQSSFAIREIVNRSLPLTALAKRN
jgi:Lrp/AsnC family transcriptional regulator, leucine-responsive regulatory protein